MLAEGSTFEMIVVLHLIILLLRIILQDSKVGVFTLGMILFYQSQTVFFGEMVALKFIFERAAMMFR